MTDKDFRELLDRLARVEETVGVITAQLPKVARLRRLRSRDDIDIVYNLINDLLDRMEGTRTNKVTVDGTVFGGGGGGTVTSVALAKTADDTIAVSGSPVTSTGTLSLDAVDPGADRLVGWDDSAGKKIYFQLGIGLSTAGTTINGVATTPPAWARVAADGTVIASERITSVARTAEGVYDITLAFVADTVSGDIQLSAVATPSGVSGDGGDGITSIYAFADDEADTTQTGTAEWDFFHVASQNEVWDLCSADDKVYIHDIANWTAGPTVINLPALIASYTIRAADQAGCVHRDGSYIWVSGDSSFAGTPLLAIDTSTHTVTNFGTTTDLVAVGARDGYLVVRTSGNWYRYTPNIAGSSLGSSTTITGVAASASTGPGCWDNNGDLWVDSSTILAELNVGAATGVGHSYPAGLSASSRPVYDSKRGGFWITLHTGGFANAYIYKYTPAARGVANTGTWTRLTDDGGGNFGTALAYDPVTDVLCVADYQNLRVIRYQAGTMRVIDSVSVDDTSPANAQVDYDLGGHQSLIYTGNSAYVGGDSGGTWYAIKINYDGTELNFGDGGVVSSVLTANATVIDDETVRVEVFRSTNPPIRADGQFSVICGDKDLGGVTGIVSSVALTMPGEFSVSGSPITSTGTLAVTKANQSANLVYAGPSSGGAAAPSFRALVAADLPAAPATSAANINAVMNGAFNIWQRGTSFTSIANNAFSADRWRYIKSGAMVHDISRSTDVPTVAEAGRLFSYSILVDCTTVDSSIAAGDYCALLQRIEGYEWAPFAQRALTLSFWVKATKTGTYCVGLVNSGNNRSYVGEYTVNSADTWEYKTVSIAASPSAGTWDYIDGTGLALYFTLAAGSSQQTTGGSWQTTSAAAFATSSQVNACDSTSNNFRLTGVQLQVGSTASEYAHIPFSFELARCMRYFEKSHQYTAAPASSTGTAGACLGVQAVGASSAQAMAVHMRWTVRKRSTTPSILTYNPGNTGNEVRNVTRSADCSSTSIVSTNDLSSYVACTTPGGSAAGDVLALHYAVDAEL